MKIVQLRKRSTVVFAYKNRHSPTDMVRLCFALFLLRKQKDNIHMPRGFVDNLEGDIAGEKFDDCGLVDDMLAATEKGLIHDEKPLFLLSCSLSLPLYL